MYLILIISQFIFTDLDTALGYNMFLKTLLHSVKRFSYRISNLEECLAIFSITSNLRSEKLWLAHVSRKLMTREGVILTLVLTLTPRLLLERIIPSFSGSDQVKELIHSFIQH